MNPSSTLVSITQQCAAAANGALALTGSDRFSPRLPSGSLQLMAERETIAVLGAGGMMGFAIARNLARAGFEVHAWDRSREKAEPLQEDGAQIADAPRDAAKAASVTLTMLADADAVTEVAKDALAGSVGEHIWLQMSTIGEAGTERCIELAREHGVSLVDAPVSGTVQPAEEGKLVVMASGPEHVRERLEPVLETIGRRTMWVGEAGMGTRLKVATNSWLASVVEGGAETLALARGMGLDPQLVLDAISGGALDVPYLQMKGKAMIEGNFEPSFKLKHAAKDARLAYESAQRRHLDLPLIETVSERLQQAVPEHGEEDVAVTFLTSVRSS